MLTKLIPAAFYLWGYLKNHVKNPQEYFCLIRQCSANIQTGVRQRNGRFWNPGVLAMHTEGYLELIVYARNSGYLITNIEIRLKITKK